MCGRRLILCFCSLQEFSSYSSLSQAQFSQYYSLPPSYAPAGLPGSDEGAGAGGEAGAGAGVTEYSAVKSEEAASAGLPPRGDSPAGIYPEDLTFISLCASG